MSKTDIVIILFTIVYGLMLTDLFSSLHKLLRKQPRIKWHWLPLLTTWYLFLIILKNWWGLVFTQPDTEWMNIIFFVAYGHLLFLIFLAVSAVLPDKVPEMGLDLESHYYHNSRYFWSVMAAIVLVSAAINIFRDSALGMPLNTWQIAINGVYLVLSIAMAIRRSPWGHKILVSLFTLATILEIINMI